LPRSFYEVVRAHQAATGLVLLPVAGEVPDQLLLLGIYAGYRVPGVLSGPGLLADATELRIPVRMLGTFNGLGIALPAEPLLPYQVTDGIRGDLMTMGRQLGRQRAGRLRRPPQRRHRITPLARLDQGKQRRDQARIPIGRPFAVPVRPPGPAQRLGARVQLINPQRYRGLADPGGRVTSRIPARPSARASAPISSRRCRSFQMREHRLKPRRQPLPGNLHHAHITSLPDLRKLQLIIP
jgi:hypothetical protein